MIDLLAAAIVFLLLHLVVSGTRLRDALVGRIGANAYMGLFSLASVTGLVWLGIAYAHARGAAGDAVFWTVTPVTRWVQIVLQVVAFQFIVIGLTTPNPTSVAQEGSLDRPNVVSGMLRITRHPFLWGVAIWAAGHLLVNGDVAGLILFGSLLVLALLGTVSIDAKRKRMLGERWTAFAAKTSNPPFGAILSRRQTLNLGEIGWWPPLLAIVIYIALLFGHPYAFGASALPNA
jgi:uncharacterized membrane protein